MFWKKQASHFDSDAEQRQAKIKELRAALGSLSVRGEKYCDEACLIRYLDARNWNVDKSRKMLKESLKWRATKRPEDIRWPYVSVEAEIGKMYKATFTNREGRTVVVMRPAKQNTSSHERQLQYLIYTLENAVLSLPEGHAKMLLKVLVDLKSAQKLNFVYKENKESMKTMYNHIDPEILPMEFGGKNNVMYNHEDYSKLMTKDDIKTASFWAADVNPVAKVDWVPKVKPQSSLIVAKAS
ncbi:phosphatidylinositol transfer protein 3-like [Triticum dicoccoides]|uniref:phosphatidylinositol transfer protein 3-like n=1 Tax=Triticum dicoccoides TaxID=85692 RepID=UPI001891D23F|nr:phosphatidylinositol transfer protein 3-like [Triticum dicoccoides]XP_044429911.1 phosphatidylinositol transfer protein 3-like [Triticum aestivum]